MTTVVVEGERWEVTDRIADALRVVQRGGRVAPMMYAVLVMKGFAKGGPLTPRGREALRQIEEARGAD